MPHHAPTVRRLVPAVALAALVAGCGGSSHTPYRVVSATGDVTVTSCGRSAGGLPVAELKVTNHSSSTADYVTVVAFSAAGTTDAFPGFERGLAEGRSTTATVTGTASFPRSAPLSCKVTSVERNPTVGTPTTT